MKNLHLEVLNILKKVFRSGIALNFAALVILYASFSSSPISQLPEAQKPISEIQESSSNPYAFDEPLLALNLLKYFDEFEPVDPIYYNHVHIAKNWSHFAFMGLHIDESYCDKHRTHFVANPQLIFEGKNYLTDYWHISPVRSKIIPGILHDLQPGISGRVVNKTVRTSWIDPRQQYFFISHFLHVFLHLGKNFGCLTQAYNHIPGHGYLNRKDFVSESITAYAKNYVNRSQCFSYEKRFPRTWVMYLKDQCLDFFANLQSEKHAQLKASHGVVYIRKIGAGAHNAEGVFPMDDEEEQKAKALYDNGKKCGMIKDNNIIQYFVPRPLLLFNRKFHFRIYMFIASVTPVMAYYRDGYVKLSLNEYDPNSNDKLSLISNVLINKTDNGNLYHGMNLTELQYFSRFELDVFQRHLLEQGIVKDPNFVENQLKPEFKKTMVHLLRMSKDKFLKRSQVYELFGLDFIMDEDLNLWFIECNSSPSLEPTYPETTIFIKNLLRDLYEIIMGLTKSRTKRVIQFINNLAKQKGIQIDVQGRPIGLQYMKSEFKKIIQNQFEPEFSPSLKNKFELIFNEHDQEPERYMGLIPEECL